MFDNRPSPSFPKAMFQSEARCEVIDMTIIFGPMQNLTFIREVLHLASF